MNVQDQKLEARIAELTTELDDLRSGGLSAAESCCGKFKRELSDRAEAAERKLEAAEAREKALIRLACNINSLTEDDWFIPCSLPDECGKYDEKYKDVMTCIACGIKTEIIKRTLPYAQALAQAEQPPGDDEYENSSATKQPPRLMNQILSARTDEHPDLIKATGWRKQSYASPTPETEIQELRSMAADWQNQFHQLESLCNKRGLTVGYGDHGQVTLSEKPSQHLPGEDPYDVCQFSACVTLRTGIEAKK
jgi:hypothetical protein